MSTIALFAGATLFQLLGASLLPMTRGMTAPGPAAAVAVAYAIGVTCMARLIVSGVNLSLLIPIITVAIVLCSVLVGVIAYGDSASPAKLAMLVVAGGADRTGLTFLGLSCGARRIGKNPVIEATGHSRSIIRAGMGERMQNEDER